MSTLAIEFSEFVSNMASRFGGAIFLEDGRLSVVEDSIFFGNTAVQGGAIYSTLMLEQISFVKFSRNGAFFNSEESLSSNSACANSKGSGGTIFISSISTNDLYKVYDCDFRDNQASLFGGSIAVEQVIEMEGEKSNGSDILEANNHFVSNAA